MGSEHPSLEITEAIFAASDKAVGSKGRQDAWRLSPFPSPNKEVQSRYLSRVGRRERWDRKCSLSASLKFCIIWNNAFREKHPVTLNQYLYGNWRISFLVWFHIKVPRVILFLKESEDWEKQHNPAGRVLDWTEPWFSCQWVWSLACLLTFRLFISFICKMRVTVSQRYCESFYEKESILDGSTPGSSSLKPILEENLPYWRRQKSLFPFPFSRTIAMNDEH